MKSENLHEPFCIRMQSGHYVNGITPNPATICIEDIARGLARTIRWRGQTHWPLTVAQHSVHVSIRLPHELQLAGLLHDASEAYLGDVPGPYKRLLPDYNKMEQRMMKAIADKFGFEYPLHPMVTEMDRLALSLEWEEAALSDRMYCYDAAESEKRFLRHYYQIAGILMKEDA